MPRTIHADGRTIVVPDDATPEEINEIVGPPPIGARVAGAGTQRQDWRDALTETQYADPAHPGNPKEFVKGVGNIGAGLLTPFLHPVDTAVGMGRLTPVIAASEAVQGKPTAYQEMAQQFVKHPLETIETGIGNAAAFGAVDAVAPEFNGPMTRTLRNVRGKMVEGARTATQSLMGAGERAVKGEVVKAGETAKTADTAHLEQTQDALHETQGRELKRQQDAQTAKENAARESKEQTAKQIADRNKAIQDRRSAEEKLTAEKLKQGKIGPTQAKLENAWSKLRAGIETARETALKVGNEKYSTVNATLNPIQADPEFMQGALADALESLKGSKSEPTILKDMTRKLERGDAFTYEDLQGDYSRLGKELVKGTLPGDEYHAYDELHEAIGNEMQRIADSEDMGSELKDARDHWRLMKQAFGKQFNPTDAATKALDTAAPDLATAADQANRIRLIGAFDSDIPKLFSHIENIQKGVDALPEPTPERTLTEKAKLPSVPARGKPVTVEPKPVAPPERVPIPDRPEQTEVNTRAARERLVDKWATGESSLNKWQVRALLTGGASALFDIVQTMTGNTPGVGTMAMEAAGTAAYTFGPAMIAKLLDNAKFSEWITRPPAGELETLQKLPNADRIKITDGLNKVVTAAQKQGIAVDPKLAALVGAATTPKLAKTRQLEQTREHQLATQ